MALVGACPCPFAPGLPPRLLVSLPCRLVSDETAEAAPQRRGQGSEGLRCQPLKLFCRHWQARLQPPRYFIERRFCHVDPSRRYMLARTVQDTRNGFKVLRRVYIIGA